MQHRENNASQKSPALAAYLASMCAIPSGRVVISDNQFAHDVQLSSFQIGATPVTVAMWNEYCSAVSLRMPPKPKWDWIDDYPIVNVSWIDIMGNDGKGGFCRWASDVSGICLALPTELQFEFASRGGQDSLAYPWGIEFDASLVWCSAMSIGDAGATAPVNRMHRVYRNAFGLSDMTGNVYQWCLDWYQKEPTVYGNDVSSMSRQTAAPSQRCARGGCWRSTAAVYFRNDNRSRFRPDRRCEYLGFRLAEV